MYKIIHKAFVKFTSLLKDFYTHNNWWARLIVSIEIFEVKNMSKIVKLNKKH